MTATAAHWNQPLLERYDLAGPRYTSYPTAPQFTEACAQEALNCAIEDAGHSDRALSLYVHIPFCDSLCYYCGCNKIVTTNKSRAGTYLNDLYREIALWSNRIKRGRPVEQLHWGGGTPSFISDREMHELMANLGRHFPLQSHENRDYSIEVHPGGLSPERLAVLRELGFNRLSIGVQDFDEQVQRAVNRFNRVEEVRSLSERAREEGFRSVSMDLIYGLPHQSVDTIKTTLDAVIGLRPDRLSLFNYAHLPELFKSQRLIDASALPAPQEKLRMLKHAIARLQDAGYVYIGMDHFALPRDSLAIAQQRGQLQRNFQGYTTHGDCDLLGLGLSSISSLGGVYLQNHKTLRDYKKALDRGEGFAISKGLVTSAEDTLRRTVINQLLCHFSLNYRDIETAFAIDFHQHFKDELRRLAPLQRDGLLETDPTGIRVTADGRLLIRRICMTFDAYLVPGKTPGYSRIL